MSFYLTGTQSEIAGAADRENALRVRAMHRCVIGQAVRDAMTVSGKPEKQRWKQDAEAWLFTDAHLEDFLEVCAAAGWSPAFVRRSAREYIARHASKAENRARIRRRFRRNMKKARQAPLFALPDAEKARTRRRKRHAVHVPPEKQQDLFAATGALCAAQ